MIKRILSIVLLLCCLSGVFMLLNIWFGHSDEHNYMRIEGIKNEPKDSLDVVLLGDSECFTGFSSALAYKKFGFTSYPYSCDSTPVSLWKTMVENVQEVQNPDLFVIEIHGVLYSDEDMLDLSAPFHYVFDSMKFSLRKLKELDYVHNYEKYNKFEFMFPFLYYHSNQDVLMRDYFLKDTFFIKSGNSLRLKGTVTHSITLSSELTIPDLPEEGPGKELGELARKYLTDFLNFCKEKKLPVIFTYFPNVPYEDKFYEEMKPAEYAETIIKEYGYVYVNFQYLMDEIGLDYYQDFYDHSHLNAHGQKKFTEYFGQYLVDKYEFKHGASLSEKAKEEWEQASQYYDVYYDRFNVGQDEWIYDSTDIYQILDAFKGTQSIKEH